MISESIRSDSRKQKQASRERKSRRPNRDLSLKPQLEASGTSSCWHLPRLLAHRAQAGCPRLGRTLGRECPISLRLGATVCATVMEAKPHTGFYVIRQKPEARSNNSPAGTQAPEQEDQEAVLSETSREKLPASSRSYETTFKNEGKILSKCTHY